MQQNKIYLPMISQTPVIMKQKCQSMGNIKLEELNQDIIRVQQNNTPQNRRKQLYHEDVNRQLETPKSRFMRQQEKQICQSDRRISNQNSDEGQTIFLRFIKREQKLRETKLKQFFDDKYVQRSFGKSRRLQHNNQMLNDDINLQNNKKVRFNTEVQVKLDDGSIITQQIQDSQQLPQRRRFSRPQLPTLN